MLIRAATMDLGDGVLVDVVIDTVEFRRAREDADATLQIFQAEQAKGIQWGEPLQAPKLSYVADIADGVFPHASSVRSSRTFPPPGRDIT